ncbi:MAG: ABC transporter permease [Spirochaetae bacterium HGW-Spirochaetae-2]|jgi:simple sugar transport system permease protein|nr:MAG: ABC transporter permease [Spirochaetae bacterium HGW-Spirochaetae-2]
MVDRMEKRRVTIVATLRNSIGAVVIVGIALAALVVLSLLLSATPLKTLRYFFLGPLQNTYYFGNMLNMAIPLIFGGLGVSLAMRSGSFNLGGEGQLYSGAFVATISALALARWGSAGVVVALFLGACTGGLLAGLSGVLRMKWNTSELITSFLVSNAVVLVVSYLIAGPFMDPATNLIATRMIPESFRFTRILEPSNLSSALFAAVIAVLVVHLYLYKTKSGYELRLFGLNPRFAAYGGIRTKWYQVWPMFLSGAFYGLAGGMAIFGTYYACMKEFSTGMGWNGLAVALIARHRPAAVIPAALFFAYIESGARNAMLHSDVTFEIASIVQSVVFFLVTSAVLQKIGSVQRRSI